MAQITINIQTLDWTMGETVGLHLMLKKDSKAGIAWGDGRVQVVTGKQEPAFREVDLGGGWSCLSGEGHVLHHYHLLGRGGCHYRI